MLNKSNIQKYISNHKYLFYSVLLINIVLLSVTKFYPSMDGAAHLYNANIIKQLIFGNKVFSDFYTLNILPIPNWTSHFVLSLFLIALPAYLAEKAFLIIYVSGMAFSFRYLVQTINPKNTALSILIFPFIYSFLFHLGFYNFSLSFILFFTTLAYWLQKHSNFSYKNYIVLFFLITISYFTNILIFGFLGLTIGLYIIYFSYINYLINKDLKLSVKFAAKSLLYLLFISLPGLIFFFIFYQNISFFSTDQSYTVVELIKWINDARAFIVYTYSGEKIITKLFFYLLLILLIASFFYKPKSKNREKSKKLQIADVISIPLLIAMVLYFVTPNGANAGMMSDRYCLLIFIFLLLWTVTRTAPFKLSKIIIPVFLFLHIILIIKHLSSIKTLNNNAVSIYNTQNYLGKNSIVLPVNFSDSWLEPHFANYLAVDKPLIILENYEANVGWFPVKWNNESLPKVLLADNEQLNGLQWVTNSKSKKIVQIDNILLYGNQNKINGENWQELKEVLRKHFHLIYKSENNYVRLYEKKSDNF